MISRFLLPIFATSVFLIANDSLDIEDKKIKTLACLYPEISHQELLEEKQLNNAEHIENLLYADKHKDKYFYKALVLDHYYNSKNIANYYKKAYETANNKEKNKTGLYYAFYLQKIGDYKEAATHLRGLGIVGSSSINVPKKIAYLYELFNLEKDKGVEAYFRVKKIDFNEIKEEIDNCSK